MAPSLSRLDGRIVAVAAAGLVFIVVAYMPVLLGDGDTCWHIAAGRWVLENRAALRIDPFSYTYGGHPWQTVDWAGEIAMALAYIGLGWNGMMLLTGAAAALSLGLLAWFLSRRLDTLRLVAVLAWAAACAARSSVAGPELLALPLFVVWMAALLAARRERRAPSFKLLAVMVLWANADTGFLVGIVLAAVLATETALEEHRLRTPVSERWALFAVLALTVSLVTPYHLSGMARAARLLFDSGDPRWLSVFSVLAAAILVLYVAVAKTGVKPLRFATLLGLAVFGVLQVRYQAMFAAAAALIIAEVLAQPSQPVARPLRTLPLLAVAAVVVLAAGLRFVFPLERADDASTPVSALEKVTEPFAPVLNDAAFGGYLILEEVRPFIDNRPELYGRGFRERYARMTAPDAALLQAALAKYHVRWTIFAPSNPTVAAMDAMKGWHRIYADRWAVVHVRNETP